MMILGPSPADVIMINYAGYENFFLHLADFPEKVRRLRMVMEKRYEALWTEILKSGAKLVLHGTHWSSAMTPPSIFREHILPYMRRFSQEIRGAGKYTAFHADADLSGLLPEVLESGVDVADCFACAPLVKLELSEARRSWKDKVIIWGGLPSTIFLPSCPQAEFKKYLQRFLDEARDGRAIMAGVSDNLMPGSLWERIKETSERVANLKIV